METVDRQPVSRQDRGFTLIEILVAIVLVGVLSAVVVIGVNSLTGKGGGAACTASRDAATSAAVSYFAVHRQFPTTLQQMVDDDQLSLADGVTLTAPLTAEGSGWTLTMVPVSASRPPGFTCS